MSVQHQVRPGDYIRGDQGLPPLPIGPSDRPTEARGNAVPEFYTVDRAIETPAGLIYKTIEMMDLLIPGDVKTVVTHKVTDRHRQLYPHQYDAFKRSEEVATSGTPLEYWGGLNKAQIRTLKAHNVFNVEALAGVSDTQMQHIGMGTRAIVERAKAFVAYQTSGQKVAEDLAAQMRGIVESANLKDAQLAQQAETINLMRQQMEQLTAGMAMGISPTAATAPSAFSGHVGNIAPAVQPAVIEGAFGPIVVSGPPVALGLDSVDRNGVFKPAQPTQDGPERRGPGRPRRTA